VWVGLAAGLVVLWMCALSACDIRRRRLPNLLTLPGAAAVLPAAALAGRGWPALAGAGALAGVYLLVHLVAPAAMGAGDVKLALGCGALAGCCGVELWFLAAAAAPLLTAFVGLVAWVRGVRTVPHGPSMCLATAAAAGLGLPG
jgi:leader peptidase (prepilin peptidase) / N-methyltransferase